MVTNKRESVDGESNENKSTRENRERETPAEDDHGPVDAVEGFLPLSRRNAILTGVGLGSLGLLGSEPASANHYHPLTKWNRHQSGQGEYSLIELASLNMAVMPHSQELKDFEGSGLEIEDSKLTVDLGSGDLDRRYLSWNDADEKLDFTGAAEWENTLEDFDGSTSPNSASGTASVAAGGDNNTASGDYSATPGGQDNEADGNHSFAAGSGAKAMDDGSFVWGTGSATSRGADSVLFQAPGSAFIAGGDLDVEDGDVGAEENVTARTGDVMADSGSVIAESDVESKTGDVRADSGSVIAESDVESKTGDVIADQNLEALGGDVLAQVGDIRAFSGDVRGFDLIADTQVETDQIVSTTDLTLDPAGTKVLTEGNHEVNGDLHVTGTKHFSTAVETSSGPKQVTYTSVEAGTPRTETSDVGELTDGRAQIDLPEHFAMVTSDEEPLSVQVTPYAEEQVHPQVTERSLDQIVVEDMGNGPDKYTFAYTVKGVREGYEDTETVRDV